jgi:hypothetical protein
MGYRSEVAYTIRFIPTNDDFVAQHRIKAKDSFYTFLAEAKANAETALAFGWMWSKEQGDGMVIDEENLSINFTAVHVKWYDEYPEAKANNKLFDLAQEWEEDNEYIGGIFVRIGESMDDVIEECWGTGDYEWLSVTRDIQKDW